MMRLKSVLLGVSVLALAGAAQAVLFTFEDQANGSSSATITSTQGGITATLTKTDSSLITVTGPLGPASWLSNSLLAFSGGSGAPMTINFSQAVDSVSIQFGDFNSDDDTESIFAYSGLNASGSLLGSNSVFYPSAKDIINGDSDVATFGVAASGILSVQLTSGGAFPFSIYWDNLSVTPSAAVPEPATLALLSLGLAGLGFSRRKQ